MNAMTNSAIRARNPQYVSSRTPRIVAAVAAIVITFVLFEGVALLGEPDSSPGMTDVAGTAVAQNASPDLAR